MQNGKVEASQTNDFPDKIEEDLEKALSDLMNQFSVDNATNTPDFILGKLLYDFLNAYKRTMDKNINWHSGWKPL